jgi:Spy/CpxP family protein refolding chaperone
VNRPAWKPWLVMVLIFVVGMIAGAALMIAFHAEGPHGPASSQQLRNHWMMHLTSRLDLTADQQAKIEPILTDAGNRIQQLHHEEVDQFAKIMDQANDQIAPLLTPDQQDKLKKMRSEREREFSGHLRPWEGSRHSPGEGGFPHDGPPPSP